MGPRAHRDSDKRPERAEFENETFVALVALETLGEELTCPTRSILTSEKNVGNERINGEKSKPKAKKTTNFSNSSSFVLGALVTTARPRLSGNLRKNLA